MPNPITVEFIFAQGDQSGKDFERFTLTSTDALGVQVTADVERLEDGRYRYSSGDMFKTGDSDGMGRDCFGMDTRSDGIATLPAEEASRFLERLCSRSHTDVYIVGQGKVPEGKEEEFARNVVKANGVETSEKDHGTGLRGDFNKAHSLNRAGASEIDLAFVPPLAVPAKPGM